MSTKLNELIIKFEQSDEAKRDAVLLEIAHGMSAYAEMMPRIDEGENSECLLHRLCFLIPEEHRQGAVGVLKCVAFLEMLQFGDTRKEETVSELMLRHLLALLGTDDEWADVIGGESSQNDDT